MLHNIITWELTCKILPGREGSPIVYGALQHPEVRTRGISKLDEDICHMEELKHTEQAKRTVIPRNRA